ncbi:MAG: hypothetical protein BA871_07390 [Desulfuromonadales bacterium C00003096]|nr:MAG: hypothetical protein BA871_07390 [Desulfuromonadales bacterium C00003096]
MSEEQAENGKSGGLSFAVTLLAALGTILYAAYIYVQTTPVNPLWYLFVRILISAATILAGGLLLYILIKGFSIEVHGDPNKNKKMRLKDKASSIYVVTFFSFSVIFVFLVCIFFWAYLLLYLNLILGVICFQCMGIIIFLIVAYILRSRYVFDLQDKISLFKSNNYQIGFFFSFLVFAIILILIVPNLTMLQGYVTVDMESIYYKSDAPIPVLIHVTGPNPILSIELQNSTKVVYNLELKPEHNLSKTEFSNNSILIGNALNYGTYNVFINTTGLCAGYYELVCTRQRYEKTYGARGFYLLNNSQKSCIND